MGIGSTSVSKNLCAFFFFHLIKGPLLYHYADIPGEPSVELTWEELEPVIKAFGFEIEVD